MQSCSVTDSLGLVNRPNVSNTPRRPSRNAANASGLLMAARHSGVARMPSVRKYWVNNWPVMASDHAAAFYQRRSTSVSPAAWLNTAACFMLAPGRGKGVFLHFPLSPTLSHEGRGGGQREKAQSEAG